MYVCVCKAVTDSQIKCALHEGIDSRRGLYKCLGVGADCGKCLPQVKELLINQKHHEVGVQNPLNGSILAA
jgi:bacterioferritin-associated ferredoxin